MDEELDIDFGESLDFEMDFGPAFEMEGIAFDEGSRYVQTKAKRLKSSQIAYSNAVRLAREIDLADGSRYDVIVSGDFIFGDFIEAYVTERNVRCLEMTISTLSLSQENVDSLKNLMEGGYVERLSMIVSHYFYSNERKALIPYIYQVLDQGDRFQLSVAGVHTKTVQWLAEDGRKVVAHGSANLRSNGNIEQFTIEENPALYDFYDGIFKKIEREYATINKAVRQPFKLITQ